jgi:hypothetical protein
VGNNEDPFPFVPRADATSRKYKRLHLVACGFQVKAHIIECHADEASNVLDANPSGPEFFSKSQHLRPEVTVIRRPSLLACNREGLAGDAAGKEINLAISCSKSP